MVYQIELLSLGEDLNTKIAEVANMLNASQSEFRFSLPADRLKDQGLCFVRSEYDSQEVWSFLEDYRQQAKGHRPYIIAVVNKKLKSAQATNLFGTHRATKGLAAVTLLDHQRFSDSYRTFLAYYLIRYATSFVCPTLKSHPATMGCFYDFKENKTDLKFSMQSGKLCSDCDQTLNKNSNPEIRQAMEQMIGVMKALQNDSTSEFKAAVLKGQIDIGILTIRTDECDAVMKHLPNTRTVAGTNRFYAYVSNVHGLSVAIARIPEQGPGAAQAAARDIISDLAPRWLFLVGIAGGIPDSDFTLGDVLIASRVHDFSVSAVLETGKIEYQQQGGPMHIEVEKLIGRPNLKTELGHWNNAAALGIARPAEKIPSKPDARFYGPEQWKAKVLSSLKKHFPKNTPQRSPIFQIAPNLSSGILAKNVELAEQWRDSARQACSIEMELGGVYLAARYGGNGNTSVLAIRGISDIVGYKRGPEWTEYACNSAAAFAIGLIRSGIIKKP